MDTRLKKVTDVDKVNVKDVRNRKDILFFRFQILGRAITDGGVDSENSS